ncbi:MAG: hypothetical protein IJI73_04930, partial [Kiritimatiellae bacterium]|nr:hypothetical protein [Kiritimatiellia bacterium]
MKSSGVIVNSKLGALAASLCAAAFAPMAVWASAYEQGTTPEIVLMAGSADGTTNTLAEAIAAYNAANETSYDVSSFNGGALKDYAIVKEGDGTLVMDTAIQSFTGPIVIKDGVVQCMAQYALGADVADHHTYVRDGATLWFTRVPSGQNLNSNRTLHIVGTGHNELGALSSKFARPTWSQNNIQGGKLYLDGDATIANPWWGHITKSLYLQGHTLTIFSAGNPSNKGDRSWLLARLEDDGKIVMNNTFWYNNSANLVSATSGNELEIGNEGGFKLWDTYFSGDGKDAWLLNFTGATGIFWGDDNNSSVRANNTQNWFGNPVQLNNTTLKVITQGNVPYAWVRLYGPVSGTGGINLEYLSGHCPFQFSIANPNNSFTGTVRVDKGRLYVHEPGSLPATASVVVDETGPLDHGFTSATHKPLDYHGVSFVTPGEHNLGPLTFKATAYQNQYYPGRIQGGSGTFSRIDKQSPNVMEYYSGIGSPFLNVEGGTFKLPRGPAPGLWEGTNNTQNAGGYGSNGLWTFSSRATSTNLVARGPNLLNNTSVAHYGAPSGNNRINTYDGYIWNRETTSVTWTFATSIGQYACVYVDGRQVVYYSYISDSNHTSPAHQFNQVTLEPGPHSFQVRACCGSVRGDNVTWPKNFGFVFDRQGREVPEDLTDYSAYTNNVELVLEPGDGSLFTRAIDEADLPHFDEMRFAAGTTLDLNGNAYVAGTISGFP